MLRFAFAPCGERFQPPEHLRIAALRTNPAPCQVGVCDVVGNLRELFHFRVEPRAATCFHKFLQNLGEDFREMCDIPDRVLDLTVGQRAAAPVGKARALINRNAEPAFDQIGIADLFALTDRHHGDLSVEYGMRGLAGQIDDNLDILPAGMEDFQNVLILG